MPVSGFAQMLFRDAVLSTLDDLSNIRAHRTRSGALAIQPPFASWIRMLNDPYGALTTVPVLSSTVGPVYCDSYGTSPVCLAMVQPCAIRVIFNGVSSFCCT